MLLVFTQDGVPTWEVSRRAKAGSSRDDPIANGTAGPFEAAKAGRTLRSKGAILRIRNFDAESQFWKNQKGGSSRSCSLAGADCSAVARRTIGVSPERTPCMEAKACVSLSLGPHHEQPSLTIYVTPQFSHSAASIGLLQWKQNTSPCS